MAGTIRISEELYKKLIKTKPEEMTIGNYMNEILEIGFQKREDHELLQDINERISCIQEYLFSSLVEKKDTPEFQNVNSKMKISKKMYEMYSRTHSAAEMEKMFEIEEEKKPNGF